MNSSELNWKFSGRENFQLMGSLWDVSAAKHIIQQHPREIYSVSMDGLKNFIGFIRMDPMITVDLTFPVILAMVDENMFMPIDGWHRINKAIKEGIPELPSIALTFIESNLVRRS